MSMSSLSAARKAVEEADRRRSELRGRCDELERMLERTKAKHLEAEQHYAQRLDRLRQLEGRAGAREGHEVDDVRKQPPAERRRVHNRDEKKTEGALRGHRRKLSDLERSLHARHLDDALPVDRLHDSAPTLGGGRRPLAVRAGAKSSKKKSPSGEPSKRPHSRTIMARKRAELLHESAPTNISSAGVPSAARARARGKRLSDYSNSSDGSGSAHLCRSHSQGDSDSLDADGTKVETADGSFSSLKDTMPDVLPSTKEEVVGLNGRNSEHGDGDSLGGRLRQQEDGIAMQRAVGMERRDRSTTTEGSVDKSHRLSELSELHSSLESLDVTALHRREEPEAVGDDGTDDQNKALTRFSRRDSVEIIKKFNKSSVVKILDSYQDLTCLKGHYKWMASFRRLDPRFQILTFFDDVAQEGLAHIEETGINAASQPSVLRFINRASVFSVWRPTSADAIRKMMQGEATGKGLEIKGKSAKKGLLSSLVPFVQIYEEKHKERIRECVRDGTMRVFYKTEKARDEAVELLNDVVEMMRFCVQDAYKVLQSPDTTPEMEKEVLKHLQWDGVEHHVTKIDDFAPNCYGVEVTERLFWEGYVMMQDCSRPPGSEHDTGRPSEPAYQDMNFKATRHIPVDPDDPRPVVYQTDSEFPMSPLTLVVAYQEHGRVLPVVSDFDCFLVGTRGVQYDSPLPPDQVELVKWTVSQIESVLEAPSSSDTWTKRWLEILKNAAIKGFYPQMPRFGFGDPKSYSVMALAVDRLKTCGAVRHGAECFNYYFPQELDPEFLVISDTLPGNVKWKYVNCKELQDILLQKVDEGFTFPLNPKWVLCDPGWKRIYDKLLSSKARNVQESLNVWFPPESGIRKHIERVHRSHPNGFVRQAHPEGLQRMKSKQFDGAELMENAEMELERFIILERVKRKIRAKLLCHCLARSLPSAKAREKEMEKNIATLRRSLILNSIPPQRRNESIIDPDTRRDYSRRGSAGAEAVNTYVTAPPRSGRRLASRGLEESLLQGTDVASSATYVTKPPTTRSRRRL